MLLQKQNYDGRTKYESHPVHLHLAMDKQPRNRTPPTISASMREKDDTSESASSFCICEVLARYWENATVSLTIATPTNEVKATYPSKDEVAPGMR